MGYQALTHMRKINQESFGVEYSVCIPDLPKASTNYGREALAFLRDNCENLKFDTTDEQRVQLQDRDGRSSGKGLIPYNMERDLDRLGFERAVGRFLATGLRQDAFDIYYCYCEIFKPFGPNRTSAILLLDMLAEHESNASSLLMRHRDHYSHSVYVFLLGLAIYRNHEGIRTAYNQRYSLTEGAEAACHFLEHWGFTALFHDVGYPFEIAHQQMKVYACRLDRKNNDAYGFAPYVSYRNMDEFALSRIGNLNEVYARAITERLAESYLDCIDDEPYHVRHILGRILRDRPVHDNPDSLDYLHMDHAYFSGIMLAKTYLAEHRSIGTYEQIPPAMIDALVAIILHNSLFKHTIRTALHTTQSLSLNDNMPLFYLLSLCDELQCWDRTSYGQSTRSQVYPFNFDLTFEGGKMHWDYVFDQALEERARKAKSYKSMNVSTGDSRTKPGHIAFIDDLDSILSIADIIDGFDPNAEVTPENSIISVSFRNKHRRMGPRLSDSSYMNLYNFALALNGRYSGSSSPEEMIRSFEDGLSLEYKLSNIAQAKGYAKRLESIDCFFTNRPVDCEPVYEFSPAELETLARSEHDRWCNEKLDMGWRLGDVRDLATETTSAKMLRELTRLHYDLVPFDELDDIEVHKDAEPMLRMLDLIREFDGLTVYRM